MLVQVEAESFPDPAFARQGLAGTVDDKQQVGAPAAGVTEAGREVRDGTVEEVPEKGRPDGSPALGKGRLGHRRATEVAKEVVQRHGGGLADQLEDEGDSARKGQRAGADEVSLRIVDVSRALLRGEIGKGAQEGQVAVQGVGHTPKFGSRLMP